MAVARVASRVKHGGHHVPEDVVRRRFAAGLRNLRSYYPAFVDEWRLFDNSNLDGPRAIAHGLGVNNPSVVDEDAWRNLHEWMR